MTALADATDPRFTDGQRAQLARFEAAPYPLEVAEFMTPADYVARARKRMRDEGEDPDRPVYACGEPR